MVADETGIYWITENRELMGLAPEHDTPVTLRDASITPIFGLAMNAEYLFFLEAGAGERRLHRVRRDGTEEQPLFSNLSKDAVFAVEGQTIAVANSPDLGDLSVGDNDSLGNSQHVSSSRIMEVVLDNGEPYWLTQSGAIQKGYATSSATQTLIDRQNQLRDLHVVNGTVFALSDHGVLVRAASDSCARVLVQPMWTQSFAGLAVDSDHIYFGALMSSDLRYSSIWRTSRAGGSAVQLTAASRETGGGAAWPLLVSSNQQLLWRTEEFIAGLDLASVDRVSP